MTLRKTTKSEGPLVPVSDETKQALSNRVQDGEDLQQAVRSIDSDDKPTQRDNS